MLTFDFVIVLSIFFLNDYKNTQRTKVKNKSKLKVSLNEKKFT